MYFSYFLYIKGRRKVKYFEDESGERLRLCVVRRKKRGILRMESTKSPVDEKNKDDVKATEGPKRFSEWLFDQIVNKPETEGNTTTANDEMNNDGNRTFWDELFDRDSGGIEKAEKEYKKEMLTRKEPKDFPFQKTGGR